MNNLTRIVIFDTESTGHHREYLQHVVRYSKSESTDYNVVLVVHPSVAAVLGQEPWASCIEIIEIASDAVADLHSIRSLWRRSLHEWKVADEYARRMNADHCVLMTLNWFQAALLLPVAHQIPYTISGIFFSPYPRWSPEPQSLSAHLSTVVTRLRKKALMWLMMRNANISAVHVLNDPRAADYLNHTIDNKRSRFRALPDPVPVLPAPQVDTNLRTHYSVEQKRTLFLFFGTLSDRKGIFRVLDACGKLSKKVQGKAALLLLGRLKDGQQEDIREQVHTLQHESVLQVRTDFRFLEPEELSLALEGCDVVLAPYQRTEGSSGVIGHAARFKRPVIGPRSGLIGELIQSYGLGNTVDTNSMEALTDALTAAVQNGVTFDIKKANRYVEERSSEAFARALLKATGCDKSQTTHQSLV